MSIDFVICPPDERLASRGSRRSVNEFINEKNFLFSLSMSARIKLLTRCRQYV